MKRLLILLLSISIYATYYAQTPSACFSTGNDVSFNKAYGSTRGIVHGDFDNDGKIDVVVGHNGNNYLNSYSFLPGLGNGKFGTPITGNSAKLSNELVAADFNQDGNLDIILSKNTGVTVYNGQGDGTFDSIANFTAGYVKFMDTGDVNLDGLLDVVISSGNGFQVLIANATPLGTFTLSTNYFLPASSMLADIRVADMDGDGKLDVVGTGVQTGNNFISFSKNTTTVPSSLTFNTGVLTYYTGGATPVALTVCDLDNDGDIDVANSHNGSADMKVFLNSGTATFPAPTTYTIGTGGQGIEHADFNGDGNQDIVVANSISGTLSIFFGTGGGTLALNQTTHSPGSPRVLTIADFNGDGKQDIVSGQLTGLYINSYLGNASNNYVLPNLHSTTGKPSRIDANDFNGDGKQDFVYTTSSSNTFSLMLGNGSGSFTPSGSFTTGTFPFGITSGDLNNDGKMDVVTADTVGNTVTVFHGNGAGSFTPIGSFAAGTRPRSVKIGDLNGDGFKDIAVTNASTNSVNVLISSGGTTFAAPVSYTVGNGPIDLVIFDLDGDSDLDIVSANYTGLNISKLTNNGTGVFTNANTNVSSKLSALDAGDFDGDGDIDVVVIGSSGLGRLYNTGGNLLNTNIAIPPPNPAGARDIKLIDANSDGKLDALILFDEANTNTGNLVLFMGNNATNAAFNYNSFSPIMRFATAVGASGLAIADFNNDSRIDAAVANYINEQISVHWNTTPKITAGGPQTFCNGNSVDLTSTSALYYTWQPSGATTQTNHVTAPIGTTNHYVTASSSWSEWCSSNSDTLKVVITAGPAAPTITPGGPTTICGSGSVVLTSSSATGNQWYKDGDSIVGATNQNYTATTSGVYTVTYISGGCTSSPSAGITVNVVIAPVITAGGPTTFCAGGSVTLTSDVTSNITWSPGGATTPSINATASGSYFVTLNVGGCPPINSNTIVVTVGGALSTPSITPAGPVTLCPSGTVTLTSSSPTDNVWSTGATTQSIIVSTAGSYYVHLDNGTCSSANSNTVVVNMGTTPPTPTITAGGPTTFCAGGSVTLTSSAGSTYLWSPGGQTTSSINVATSGTYSVVVTNAAGCSSPASSPVTVTVNPLPSTPTITAGGATTFCAGGSVTLSAPTSTSYLWSPGGETTQNIIVTSSGTYTCQVGDANGCMSLASNAIVVTVNALPSTPTISAGGPTTFCAGGSVTLTSSAGSTYLWSPGSLTTSSINVTTSGTYSVVVTNAAGCTSPASSPVTVTVNPLPSTPTITAGGATTFCAGGSVILSAPTSTSYLWTPGNLTTQNINVTSSGTYTCQVGDANGCMSLASNAIVVTVNALPATPTITPSGPTTFCAGGSVTLTAPTSASYLWSPGSDITQNIIVTSSGSYSVVVTNAAGCSSLASSPVVVTVNTLPAAPSITPSGPTTFCAGGSVTLTSTAGSSYLWSPGSFTTSSINVTTSGTYSVVVTNAAGCSSPASSPVTVTVNPLPSTPTITAGGAITFCAGGSVTLSAPTSTSYLWSPGGETTQNIIVTSSGTYTCQVGDANGCMSLASNAIVVTVNALPSTPTISAGGATTFCAGGSVTLTSSAGSTYLWSPNNETTSSINVTSSGTYSVVVTNAAGCTSPASSPITVTVNPLPSTPTITAGGPITFCAGGSVILSAPTSTSYLWSPGGETTQNINVTSSGTYTCQVGDANGCMSLASNAIVVTVNALPATPTITPSGPTTFCAGGSVTLTSSSENDYLWSNSATSQSINVTSSGAFTVQTINVAGCMSASSSTINVTVIPLPTTPTITPSGPTTFCAGGSVTLTSSAGSTYLWSPGGETTSSINVTTSGTYSVVVTNPFGCQSASSSSVIVTVNPLPATPSISAGGPITFCAGGSVTLSAPTSTSYLWNTGSTLQSINVTNSGTFTVQVADVNGCYSNISAPVNVTVNPLPSTPTISAGGPTTFCAGGSVTLSAPLSSGYLWSTGQTTQNINVTTSGTYTVQVTNAAGCLSASSSTVTVTVNPLPTTPVITAGGPTTFCAGGSVILSSTPSSTYLWSNSATTQNITVSTAGSYSVKVTDANGCVSLTSNVISVTVNSLPTTPVISAGGATTFCAGGSVTLSSTPSSTYLWSNSATTQSINVTASGTFTVQVTDVNGCVSGTSAPVNVTVNPIPPTPTITAGGPTTFCSGGSVVLTSSSASGNLWSTGSTNQSITVSSTGTYTVTVTTLGCTSPAASQTVTVNPLPTTPTITVGGATTFCIGGSVTLTAPTSTSYLWSNGATTQSIVVSTTGSYTVQVTNSNGCQSLASAAVNVTVNALPPTPTITAGGPTTFCAGSSVLLSSTPSASYLWSNSATTQTTTVSTSGNYSVVVTDGNGCQSAPSNVISVTVNTLPPPPTITAGGPTTFCAGGSVNLSSSPGVTYIWSNSGSTQNINVTTSGNYTVQITDANGCLSPSSSITTVTVNPLPSTPIISASGSLTFCAGNSVDLSCPTSSGYLWSPGGETTQTITVTTSGVYSVQRIDANGCISASSPAVTVTVNPIPPTPTITAGGPTTFCSGGSVTLTSSSSTGNLWSTSSTNQSITVSSSGTYTVTVTALGCTSPAASQVVTVNPLPSTPTITVGGPTTFCFGGSVTLTAPTSTGYLWSTGATTQSIIVSTTGAYTVQVTNSNGCQSLASTAVNVTVNALPPTPTITAGGPTTFCAGSSVTLTSSASTSYLWSNSATTQATSVNSSGNYSVIVTDANGCQSAASNVITVTVNTLPTAPTVTAGGPTTFCAGGSVTLTSSAGSTYLWTPGGLTTSSIVVNTSGNYSVVITDGNGCQSLPSADVTVTVNPLPSTPVISPSGPTTFCAGNSVDLTCPTAAGYLWSNGATTQTITVTTSGTFTVQRINAAGCISAVSAPITVTVNPIPPTPTITAGGPTSFCMGGSVTLTSSSSVGNLWAPGGQTTQNITVSSTNTYTLTVTISGCTSAPASQSVTVNPLPVTPNITASGPTTFCFGSYVDLAAAPSGYSYQWLHGPTTQVVSVSTSGSYQVMITDGNGCSSPYSNPMVVTVNPLPPTPAITAGGPTTFCTGGSVTLTAPTSTAYLWSTGATTQSINVTTSGSFTVKVYNINGCESASSLAVNVTVNPLPPAPTITAGGPTTFCAGGSVTLSSTIGNTYIWSNSANTQNINISTAGTYTAQITDNNGCLSPSSNAIAVVVNALPPAPVITAGGPTTFCAGDSVLLSAPAYASYLWSTGATSQSIYVYTAGTYTVQVTNLNGCTSPASASTSITVNPIPPTPTITPSGPTTFCAGNTIILTSSASTGNLWSTSANTQSITVGSAGTYTLAQTLLGCTSPSTSITITVNPIPPAPIVTASGPTTFCAGGSVDLTSSISSSINWSTSETTQTITVSATGNYTVTQTVLGCTSLPSSPINVVVHPIPPVPTITAGGPTTFCAGGSVTLTSSAPTGNIWSTGATTQSITVNSAGTYLVQVILNGCSSGMSAPSTISVNPLPPTPSITNGTTASFCAGSSMVLNSSASTGNLWSTFETTPSITITAGGSYTVQIIDGNGCTSLPSTPIVVTADPIPNAPVINPSGPTTFCYGDQVTLTSSFSTGNNWSNGSTANAITVSMVGDYAVTHTDANGCISLPSDTVHVIVNPIPAAPTISANGPLSFCAGGNVTLTSSQPTGNSWSNASFAPSITVSTSGVYSVIYIDSNGCSSPSSAPVIVSVMANPPIPSITAGGPTIFCAGNSVTLTSSNTSGNLWSNGATTQNVNITLSGNYSVTYTNINGCSSTSTPIAVTVIPISTIPTITASGSTTICDGTTVTLTSSSPTDNVWSTGATTQSIVVGLSGSYTVIGNQTGCPSPASAPIVVSVTPAPPVPDVVPSGPTTICQGDELYLFTSASGSLLWSTGYSGQVLQVTTSGAYFVKVTNAYGCSAQSAPINVVVNSLPTVTLTPIASMCKETTAPFVLSNGIPAGGTYTGNGVTSNVFYPAQVNGGATIVTYTYTDVNGCKGETQQPVIVYSCLGIEENSIDFSLYPNPNDGRFTVTSTGKPMDQLVIYDAQGKIVYDQTTTGVTTVQFNLNEYSNGVYYIEIYSKEGLLTRKPLVINH